jgi:methionyl-tRNA formyltransferase
MQMEEGLDTGPMLLREAVAIDAESDAASLRRRLAALGAALIDPALRGIAAGTLVPVPQPAEGVTYAAKLARDEGRLDWREEAAFLVRKVRALNPSPGVWFEAGGERIKVTKALAEPGRSAAPGTVIDARLGIACAGGVFRPLLLQRPGRAALSADAFLRGFPLPAGTLLPCLAGS